MAVEKGVVIEVGVGGVRGGFLHGVGAEGSEDALPRFVLLDGERRLWGGALGGCGAGGSKGAPFVWRASRLELTRVEAVGGLV